MTNANVTLSVHGSTKNYKIAGLERVQTYCVRILAYNEYRDGEISNCTEVTTAQGNLISSYLPSGRSVRELLTTVIAIEQFQSIVVKQNERNHCDQCPIPSFKRRKQCNEPIRIRIMYMILVPSAGKCVRASHDS